ncbi:MAG: hypothetical protein HRU02_02205 [Myxococcales bacterium]|nr:hypothetical protein [Myxococcales bacterium]
MSELKRLASGDVSSALALAEQCRATGEADAAESICLDVLELESENQSALLLLLLARTDLLERGLPHGVDRAREVLPRLAGEYERAYYGGVICERQARTVLGQRGKRSGFVAFDWFRYAMEQYEEAAQLAPERLDATLRYNACARTIERNRHCQPAEDDRLEHGIE